jgi:hypothetical protein
VPVAAAGNEFQDGNPLEFPASLPHVITVAAVGPDDRPTGFSSESAAVDLSAPGLGILTAVPAAFDTEDGTADGYTFVDGTSFSSPMVAAAVAWVRAARPELTPYQAAQVVRVGARDVGRRGYEDATGFGVLNLPGALARRPPAEDPQEPNDDIRYVNGRAFRGATSALFRGRPARVSATADYAEDPVDVYRLKLRPGRRVRLKLNPSVGDPDLFVFGPKARSVRSSRSLASPHADVLRRRRVQREQGHRALQHELRAARPLTAPTSARPARGGTTAPGRGRPCPRARPASGPAGCRAGTTRRRAPPGSPSPPR